MTKLYSIRNQLNTASRVDYKQCLKQIQTLRFSLNSVEDLQPEGNNSVVLRQWMRVCLLRGVRGVKGKLLRSAVKPFCTHMRRWWRRRRGRREGECHCGCCCSSAQTARLQPVRWWVNVLWFCLVKRRRRSGVDVWLWFFFAREEGERPEQTSPLFCSRHVSTNVSAGATFD